MEEKAELLFKPGCKAGSEYCGKCPRKAHGAGAYLWCSMFEASLVFKQGDDHLERPLRLPECLEAEAQTKELREENAKLKVKVDNLSAALIKAMHESGGMREKVDSSELHRIYTYALSMEREKATKGAAFDCIISRMESMLARKEEILK